MIDFRYHLVSLISVFLALAVGIALGAGPLKGVIGDQLTGQVEQLRVEKDQLRTDLDAASAQLANRDAYLEAAAVELLDGVLPRTVAVLTLPGADGAVVERVVDSLEDAGANVDSRLAVTTAWADDDTAEQRAALAAEMADDVADLAADASAEATLAAALAQALTSSTEAGALAPQAEQLLDALRGDFVDVTTPPSVPAEAIVVVARSAGTGSPVAVPVELLVALDSASQGLVVGGSAVDSADVVSTVRADGDLAGDIATVDTIGDVTGRTSLPRALAAAISGSVGHYGFASSASSVLPPRVVLEPVATESAG